MVKQSGFALLEILICVVLLSCLLLGMDALQLSTLRTARNFHYSALANLQILNMREILLASKSIDAMQYAQWNADNAELLPHGRGEVSGNYPNYQVRVQWGSKNQCLSSEVIV